MTDTDVTIDIEQITTLISQYHDTEDRAKQREIENSVLAETVWNEPPTDGEEEFCITKGQVDRVYKELPDDAKGAKPVARLGSQGDGTRQTGQLRKRLG